LLLEVLQVKSGQVNRVKRPLEEKQTASGAFVRSEASTFDADFCGVPFEVSAVKVLLILTNEARGL
jgi:hypothetical protein